MVLVLIVFGFVFVSDSKSFGGKIEQRISDMLDNLATVYMTGWSEPASLVGPPFLSADDLFKKEQQQRQHCW